VHLLVKRNFEFIVIKFYVIIPPGGLSTSAAVNFALSILQTWWLTILMRWDWHLCHLIQCSSTAHSTRPFREYWYQ